MMNRLKEILTVIFICLPFLNYAQSKVEVVRKAQELMLENYVFLDKAKETNSHLDSLLDARFFESFDCPKEFAKLLSAEMRKVTEDRHLNIVPPPPPNSNEETHYINRHLSVIERFRQGGFGKIDLLEGNVGYVELKGFRREDIPKVDAIMNYFSTADALIIDLRENGGGNSLGLYWSSYFLEDNVVLSGKYERRTDNYSELKTVEVEGDKRLDLPLYILTSNFTFSAAKAFAYDLQSRNRAVVIGESTGGGAHPVNFMSLEHGFGIIMPYAQSINPVTKTNWEGIGVQPDIPTSKQKILVEAQEIAKKAAKKYREEPFLTLKEILSKKEVTQDEKIYELIELLLRRKHLEDFMVNNMGYFYLDNDQTSSALAIFKANLRLFPYSPNAHDSYAETLALLGEKKKALYHFKQAVSLAEAQNDRNLTMYKKNLSNFEATLNP